MWWFLLGFVVGVIASMTFGLFVTIYNGNKQQDKVSN